MAFQIDDYYDLTIVGDVAVSPDGERVAFTADEFDADDEERLTSVFVAPTDGSADPHRLTQAGSASTPAWSPDGDRLAFLAARDPDTASRVARRSDGDEAGDDDGDDSEDEEPAQQVWAFDLARGGDARRLTDFEEGADDYDWGPAGERLVVAARDPTDEQREYLDQREAGGPVKTERLQHKYDGQGWLDDVRSFLFVVDAETGETDRLDDAHGGPVTPTAGLQPDWSPDGRIAFRSKRMERPDDETAVDVYLVDPDDGDATRVTDGDVSAGAGAWSPDGGRYAFAVRNPENGYEPTRLYVTDGDDYGPVSASLDRPLGRGFPVAWTDEKTLLGAVGDEGWTRLVRFDATADDPVRVGDDQRPDETVEGLDVAGGVAAVVRSAPDATADVYTTDADDLLTPAEDAEDGANSDAEGLPTATTRVTATNADLEAGWDLPGCRRVEFASEGVPVEALCYTPPGVDLDAVAEGEAERPPLLVSIHGGPVSYDAPGFGSTYAMWADEGYLVLRVNYRGSSSYGQAFSQAIEGDYGTREPTDVVNGIHDVLDRGWADPDRVFVTGFSYGGAQTAYILTQSDVATAGAAEHGVYDRASYFGTGDSHNRMERDFGLPWEHPGTYDDISSITDVGEIDVPLLVTAGGDDWRCPPTQSEQLYVSVRKQGVPARLVVYPDEHHNVGDPDRATDRLQELRDWFRAHDPGRE